NSTIGSASTSEAENPNWVNDGPRPRTTTCFGVFPVMMKPPIPTSSPVPVRRRVDRFSACVGVVVGVAGGVEVAVAVAVAVGLALGLAVGVAVAVAVGVGAAPGTHALGSLIFVTAMSSR